MLQSCYRTSRSAVRLAAAAKALATVEDEYFRAASLGWVWRGILSHQKSIHEVVEADGDLIRTPHPGTLQHFSFLRPIFF